METRELGDTGQTSSILTLGAIALSYVSQSRANELLDSAVELGINHVDVAPTYGDAEEKLAPRLDTYRDELFLGCKTQERTYFGAWGELHRSLDRLGVDSIDLYQFHAVTGYDELAAITGSYTPEMAQGHDEGALQAFLDAKDAGLIDHIGLTSHGDPALIRSAINRISELDTVMFPYNYTLAGKDGPEHDYDAVLDLANDRGLGTLCIKAFTKGSWPTDIDSANRPYETWYEPYVTTEELTECLRFALSQGMTTIPSAGDPELLPTIMKAAADYEPLNADEQTRLRERGRGRDSPVPTTFSD